MRQYREHQIRTHQRAQREKAGVLLADGHSNYGNGHHASSYLDLSGLASPVLVWRIPEYLVDVIPQTLTARAEIVGGPGTADVILAHLMAGFSTDVGRCQGQLVDSRYSNITSGTHYG